MSILIVYDSSFGNTERIARSIGNALASSGLPASPSVLLMPDGGATWAGLSPG